MANMTISEEGGGGRSRIRKVVFTHTSAATATGSATTTFGIRGRLLAAMHTGGDAEWQFTLTNGTATLYSSGNLAATTLYKPIGIAHDASTPNAATDAALWGIPMANEPLTCNTTNVSGTAPTITVYWEDNSA